MNYYIGMHETIDYKKYKRDYCEHFVGIEFCNFESAKDVVAIQQLSLKDNLKVGVHFPLIKSSYKYRDPHINTPSEEGFEGAMSAIEKELILAKSLNADYLLIHFPKPMVLDFKLNWSIANFGDYDVIREEDISYDRFYQLCDRGMRAVQTLGQKYGIQMILELELFNQWLYKTDMLCELLDKYSDLKLCLDTARLHVVDCIDPEFDLHTFVKKHVKYTNNVHLANIHVKESISHGHHPPVRALNQVDGWCDLEKLLTCFEDSKYKLNVLYEHQSTRISDQELQNCYQWVEQTLSINKERL